MPAHDHTPNQESTANTAAELPTSEAAADRPDLTERVGQRRWTSVPDPFELATDNLAGIRLFESKRDRQMAIQFGDGRPDCKPSAAVIDKLKHAGFRWDPADRIWAHPVTPESAMRTRIEADRLYHEICDMIRGEKGVASGPETAR